MADFDISKIFSRSIVPFRFVFLMWLFFAAEFLYGIKFHNLGILPRNLYGLIGVITAPLLHINLVHILSNTLPLLVLGMGVFYFYYKHARIVFLVAYFLPNILVWIFARPVMHLGASGIIYAMATYLVFMGIFLRDKKSLIIAVLVLLLYSGLFFGLSNTFSSISYELHFAGVFVGVILAAYSYFKLKSDTR